MGHNSVGGGPPLSGHGGTQLSQIVEGQPLGHHSNSLTNMVKSQPAVKTHLYDKNPNLKTSILNSPTAPTFGSLRRASHRLVKKI